METNLLATLLVIFTTNVTDNGCTRHCGVIPESKIQTTTVTKTTTVTFVLDGQTISIPIVAVVSSVQSNLLLNPITWTPQPIAVEAPPMEAE